MTKCCLSFTCLQVDVFAFGLIMYELFRMELSIIRLLSRCLHPEEMESKLQEYAKKVSTGFRERIPAHWPAGVRELIKDCWNQDPDGRPRMGEVLSRLHAIQETGRIEELDTRIDQQLAAYSAARCCLCVIS